ncbi:hypothetical protein TWF281_010338 [Arthrobotrys megalospora]
MEPDDYKNLVGTIANARAKFNATAICTSPDYVPERDAAWWYRNMPSRWYSSLCWHLSHIVFCEDGYSIRLEGNGGRWGPKDIFRLFCNDILDVVEASLAAAKSDMDGIAKDPNYIRRYAIDDSILFLTETTSYSDDPLKPFPKPYKLWTESGWSYSPGWGIYLGFENNGCPPKSDTDKYVLVTDSSWDPAL